VLGVEPVLPWSHVRGRTVLQFGWAPLHDHVELLRRSCVHVGIVSGGLHGDRGILREQFGLLQQHLQFRCLLSGRRTLVLNVEPVLSRTHVRWRFVLQLEWISVHDVVELLRCLGLHRGIVSGGLHGDRRVLRDPFGLLQQHVQFRSLLSGRRTLVLDVEPVLSRTHVRRRLVLQSERRTVHVVRAVLLRVDLHRRALQACVRGKRRSVRDGNGLLQRGVSGVSMLHRHRSGVHGRGVLYGVDVFWRRVLPASGNRVYGRGTVLCANGVYDGHVSVKWGSRIHRRCADGDRRTWGGRFHRRELGASVYATCGRQTPSNREWRTVARCELMGVSA